MVEVQSIYTEVQLNSDDVSKKDIVSFLQQNSSGNFQADRKLKGKLVNVAKQKTKAQLISDYNFLFETKDFKSENDIVNEEKDNKDVAQVTEKLAQVATADEEEEKPKYIKSIIKKGDKITFPKDGDLVSVFYKGCLADGTEFDSNIVTGPRAKSAQPFRFRVGQNQIITGWNKVIKTMSSGEKAKVVIEPEWAYGRRGKPENGIPKDATLTFEIELVRC